MKALLCSPDFFGVEYEINPWMHREQQPNRLLARTQWDLLCKTLSTLGVTLEFITPRKGQPDMVFTANGGLVRGDQVVLPNFRHPQRQGETAAFASWFLSQEYQLMSLPESYPFEGEGDALFCGDRLFAGYQFRTHLGAHRRLGELLGTEVISLLLVDPHFYHLDTCLFPVNPELALYYPPAFDEHCTRLLQTHFKQLIPLTETDGQAFCCNGLAVGRHLILPRGSDSLTLAEKLSSLQRSEVR